MYLHCCSQRLLFQVKKKLSSCRVGVAQILNCETARSADVSCVGYLARKMNSVSLVSKQFTVAF